jgi:hypothetical protein
MKKSGIKVCGTFIDISELLRKKLGKKLWKYGKIVGILVWKTKWREKQPC